MPAARYFFFIRDFSLMKSIWSFWMPVETLKSVRRRASCSSQYSFMDSIQSILPYLYEKKAVARKTSS